MEIISIILLVKFNIKFHFDLKPRVYILLRQYIAGFNKILCNLQHIHVGCIPYL